MSKTFSIRRSILVASLCFTLLSLLLPVSAQEAEAPPALELKKGHFTATFTEHHPLCLTKIIYERARHKGGNKYKGTHHEIKEETFQVYVPKAYDGSEPYGVFVWISSGDSGRVERSFANLLDTYKLIWIGADKSGNGQGITRRRLPLALDGAHNIQKLYKIDPRRVYLGGVSGGGRSASQVAIQYADVFTGAIFCIGVNGWEEVKVPGKNSFWSAAFHKPKTQIMSLAKKPLVASPRRSLNLKGHRGVKGWLSTLRGLISSRNTASKGFVDPLASPYA